MNEVVFEFLMYLGALFAMASAIGLFICSLVRSKRRTRFLLRLSLILGIVLVLSPYIALAKAVLTL